MALLGSTRRLLVKIDGDATGITKGLRKGMAAVDGFDKSISDVAADLGKAFAVAGAAIALGTKALGEFTKSGGEYIQVQRAFANAVGDTDLALINLRRDTMGLVSDYDLMQQANTALALGSADTAKEFGQLAGVSIKLARALGIDQKRALESLNTGIARQSRLYLDNLGIILSVTDANKDYADSIGKNVSELSDEEKRLAFRQGALKKADELVEKFGEQNATAADAVIRMEASISNFVTELQELIALSPGIEDFFSLLATGITSIFRDPELQATLESLSLLSNPDVIKNRRAGLASERPGLQMQLAGAHQAERRSDAAREAINPGDEGGALLGAREAAEVARLTKELTDNAAAIDHLDRMLIQLTFEAGRAAESVGELTDEEKEAAEKRAEEEAAFQERANRRINAGDIPNPNQAGMDADLQERKDAFDEAFGGLKKLAPSIAETMELIGEPKPLAKFIDGLNEAEGGLVSFAKGIFESVTGGGGIGGLFNPEDIVSGALGGLLSGGISIAVGALSNAIGGLFGGSGPTQFELDQEEALKRQARNTDALVRLTSAFSKFNRGITGVPIAGVASAIAAALAIPDSDGRVALPKNIEEGLAEALNALGLSMDDLRDLAAMLGIEFTGTRDDAQALLDAIATIDLSRLTDTFAGAFDFLSKEFDLLDIDDPGERVSRVMEILAESLGSSLFAAFDGAVASGTLDDFIRDLFADIRSGDFDIGGLGTLSLDEFLDALGFVESSLDSLGDAANAATDAFRNVPSGLKVAALVFSVSDAEPLRAGVTDSVSVNIEQLILPDVRDPAQFFAAMEREAEKGKRRGGARTIEPAFPIAGGF